ncbi:triose-phosphate isomerase [Sulfodiicoccus acidiphilus]|uniref:Triosephosphate isomerase n=1 Tax=Sulfodiicoccus acidiphilus TaxID=1670455 RepID=A0A348B459_9CREN|nr:triose-phosphate isomerase [Sulfodiicoccus acidiphilus]BBD72961.1 triose-phosphate isomerase [Sulfodiicoccus acidiphilus]GGT87698.1 triose-phosphate isomerase [Sulfodiicoccus acidiphilus]
MRTPIVIVNFKLYEISIARALDISKSIEQVSRKLGVEVALAVPATMIREISSNVSLPIYAQHVDDDQLGAHTGSITPELIKEAGARGTLLNHSERRIRLDQVANVIERLSSLGMDSVLCVDRRELVAPAALMGPTAVLVEPPELIGSGRSVSKVRPEIVSESVKAVKVNQSVRLIVGAGISTYEDVIKAMELGADGVGAASAVMKSNSPASVVEEFAKAIRDRRLAP